MNLRQVSVAAAVAAATLILGPSSAAAPEVHVRFGGQAHERLLVKPYGTVVRRRLWKVLEIPVCWDDPPLEGEQRYRDMVREAVVESWAKHSRITFPNWGICASADAPGVHIVVRDELVRTLGLGRYLDRRPGGVILNFRLQNWQPACTANTDDCIRLLAVHEFGHVLGFAHEQLRGDAPGECGGESGTLGARGTWDVTVYDPGSIMNYCSPVWRQHRTIAAPGSVQVDALSELDQVAVAQVYGARI